MRFIIIAKILLTKFSLQNMETMLIGMPKKETRIATDRYKFKIYPTSPS